MPKSCSRSWTSSCAAHQQSNAAHSVRLWLHGLHTLCYRVTIAATCTVHAHQPQPSWQHENTLFAGCARRHTTSWDAGLIPPTCAHTHLHPCKVGVRESLADAYKGLPRPAVGAGHEEQLVGGTMLSLHHSTQRVATRHCLLPATRTERHLRANSCSSNSSGGSGSNSNSRVVGTQHSWRMRNQRAGSAEQRQHGEQLMFGGGALRLSSTGTVQLCAATSCRRLRPHCCSPAVPLTS